MTIQKFTINEYTVLPNSNTIINSTGQETRLEPKIMQVLVFMAKNQGRVIKRDELLNAVWSETVISEVLNNTVAILRKSLGDTKSPRRYIETIPKQGYRLIAPVVWHDVEEPADASTSSDNSASSKSQSQSSIFKNKRILLTSMVAIFIVAIILFQYTKPFEPSEVEDKHQTIAILPFDVFDTEQQTEIYAEGLVEELIHQLALDPNLRVTARTSSGVFKNTKKDIREIAAILGVRYLIEGSIRQNNTESRVTVQLIDSLKGFHIWSKTFDHLKDSNILETQEFIATKISALISPNAINTTNQVIQKRSHPKSSEAYKKFLLAQAYMKSVEIQNLQKALKLYQEAIELEPNYALAHSGVAAAHLLLYQYNFGSIRETVAKASEAIDRALELEPNLAEAFSVRGLMKVYQYNYKVAEENFIKAIELKPALRFARHNYGFLLWNSGRIEEALEQFQIALSMDPLSPITNFGVGDSLMKLGRLNEAEEHYKHCQNILPNEYSCSLGMARTYKLKGDLKQSQHFTEIATDLSKGKNFYVNLNAAFIELASGRYEEAKSKISALKNISAGNYYLLKLDLILNLAQSSLTQFENEVKELIIKHPRNDNFNRLLATTAYFQNNCEITIAQYQKTFIKTKKLNVSIHDYDVGLSHGLNLAYCFKQRNLTNKAEIHLKEFKDFIQELPASSQNIQGKLYNEARYLKLSGKDIEAKRILMRLQSWEFIWLAKLDPIWSNPD